MGWCIFGATPNGVWRSTDSGSHWSKDSTAPISNVTSFAILGTLIFGANGTCMRSTDSGTSWTQFSIPRHTIHALAVSGTYLFAGTDTGVYISIDSGSSWRNVNNDQLPNHYLPNITALAVYDTLLFAAVDSWHGNGFAYATARSIPEMVKEAKSAVQQIRPTPTTLAVYPNPLTNSTAIAYTLSNRSRITIIIGDALGRTISTLIATEEDAGTHSITFDASQLPSGVYWCHLTAGTVARMAKIVIER